MVDRPSFQVVGVDGSEGSAAAVRWAAAHVEQFGPVRPVAAWSVAWWATPSPMVGSPVPPPDEYFVDEAQAAVDQAVSRLEPSAVHDPLVARGSAGEVLVDAARDASVLVVGTRGHGAIVSAVLGSVSSHCAHHATVPIVVVPEEAVASAGLGRVVVGVDGSDRSVAALEWALRHAASPGRVTAVHAWAFPVTYGELGVPDLDTFEAGAAETLRAAVEAAAGRVGIDPADVPSRLTTGDARTILREAEADTIVVGARGLTGLGHLLLGSVSSSLVHHPTAVTVVVPEPDERS